MAEPRWSLRTATPAAVGTPEAKGAPPAPDQGRWSLQQPGEQQVSWPTLTGQNMEGTNNAFDTTFWQRATEQDEEAMRSGRMGERWSRSDATGVVVYDDPTRGLTFGDVYLDGVKQGNLREGYAGLNRAQGTEMLARLVLPREVWAKAYENEAGRPLTLAASVEDELERERQKRTENYAKGLSAAEFEAGVRERAAGFEESGLAQGVNVAGGAAGGAVIGAGIGSILPGVGTALGAGIGAVVGGIGSWLNRDEQFTRAAQAMEQYELARQGGYSSLGVSDAALGWMGVVGGTISPVRNLIRGVYDAAEGELGDQRSTYNEQGGPAWFEVLDTAGLLVDGIGSFGSATAVKTYTAVMGGTAAAGTASVVSGAAEGNVGFDPYAGTYREIGLAGTAMRAGAVGIDVLQTAAGRSLLSGGMLRGAPRRTEAGGYRIREVDGVRVADRLGFSALIPSEAATALSARMLARRAVRRSGEPVTREALARQTAVQIDRLTSGRRAIATMAVNAIGEGSEEVVQASLEALSVGEMPTLRELFNAYRQGAAMGAGMGLAVARGSASRSDQWRAASEVLRRARGEEPLTDEQWAELSDHERAIEGRARTPEEDRLWKMATAEAARVGGKHAVANVPELQRAWAVVQAQVERDARNSQPLNDVSRMSVRSNYEWGPQDAVVSLTAAMRAVAARGRELSRVASGEPVRRKDGRLVPVDEAQRAYAERVATTDRILLQRMEQAQAAIDASGNDPEVVRREVGALNAELREWWSSQESEADPEAYGRRRSVSVLSTRFPLNSAGSFQLLRLQVSPTLTQNGAHHVALMPDEIQPMIGGDFDGDMTNDMLRLVLPDESYRALRHGAAQLTSDGAMMAAKGYVVHAAEVLFDAMAAEPGTALHQVALDTVADVRRRLHEILDRSSLAAVDRDRMIEEFIAKLSSRDAQGAFRGLFTELPTRYAVQMEELAEQLDGSPWLLLNRAVEDALTQMGTRVAQTDLQATSSTGAVDLPATSEAVAPYRAKPERATSEILTGAIETSSWNIFRLQTIFKYNAYREPTVYTEEEQNLAIAALVERFTALNDGLVRSGDDAAFETTLAQERTLAWLEDMAAEYHRDLGSVTRGEALVLMAGAQVPDVEVGNRALRSKHTVNLTQAALHEVITQLRREYATILSKNESVALRLSSLDSLTVPDRQEGESTRARGGSAFVEVLGAFPIAELLGDAAANVQSYTVRGLRDALMEMRADVREEFVRALRAHPHYDQEVDSAGAKVTPYRVLVDNVVESARMELHETAEGLPAGERAKPEADARANFRTLHDSVRGLLNARKLPHDTGEDVRAALEADPSLAVQVLNVLGDRGLAAELTQYDEAGNVTEVQFPTWVYDVLAEPSTARAEMDFLRNTLFAEMAARTTRLGDATEVAKESDRILRLWMDLDFRANDLTNERMVFDRVARDDFMTLLLESATVDQFLGRLNSDYRFRPERSAPYMAWVRDRSAVEADRYGRGVSDVVDGQTQREALRSAAAAAARALQVQADTERYLKENARQIDIIRASRDDGLDPEPWARFQRLFELARRLPVLVSVSLMIEQAAHINEILSGMGVKGQAPSNVAALGRAIAAQLPTFDSALGRLFASVTSGSVNAVLTDMTQLARGQRTFVMNDGTVVDWDGITAEQALDMLADPRQAGLAARMMGLTAWDFNSESGITTLTSVLDKGVAGFAMDIEESLFGRSQMAKFRRLMLVEGEATSAGGPPVLPVELAIQMNLRETAVDHVIDPRSEERQRMAVSILEDIADALQAVSTMEGLYQGRSELMTPAVDEVTGETTTRLNLVLRKAGRRARQATNTTIGRLVAGLEGEARNLALGMITSAVQRLGASAAISQDPVGLARAKDLTTQLRLLDDYVSPVELLVEEFKDFTDPRVQQRILGMLRSWGDVANVVAWARPEILRALNPRTPQVTATASRFVDGELEVEEVTLPDLKAEQWHVLARAVIAFTMHTSFGITTSSDVQIAEFPSLTDAAELDAQIGYWDPSGVKPVLDMLVPNVLSDPAATPTPLLAAQLDLVREHGAQVPRTTEDEAERAVYRLFEPAITDPTTGSRSGVVGQWHALVPALMHAAVGTVMSSSAETGISMAGKNPQRMRFFAATTARDWSRRPTDAELSETLLPVNVLTQGVATGQELNTPVAMQVAVGSANGMTQVEREGVLAHLEGRIARAVELVAPDGTTVNLLGHPRFGPGLALPASAGVAPGEAGVIVLDTLSASVATLLREQNVPPAQWAQWNLRVSFFHPHTKAVSSVREDDDDYSHSAWFDGVSGKTRAAFNQPSLMGFLYFGLDGAIPQAYERSLGAIKKLHFALQQVTTMPESVRRGLMARGLTDMAGMLDEITRFMLQQPIDGKPMSITNYNALRKFVELLYVVRFVDESGRPQVLSVDKVIARQQRGESFGPDSHAQVVGLPIEHVLELMGEKDLSDPTHTVWGMADYAVDLDGARPYVRFPAEAWTDRMLGGLVATERDAEGRVTGWATANLLDYAPLQNLALPRTSVRRYERLASGVSQDAWLPYRKQQSAIHEARANDPQSGVRWARQRELTRRMAANLRESNLVGQALAAVQMLMEGDYTAAAAYRAGDVSTDLPSHDFTTGWVFLPYGARSGPRVEGVLVSTEELASSVTLGDIVHIIAGYFLRRGNETVEEVWPQAREVLDTIMATGATIHVPASLSAGPLVARMHRHLREHGYARSPESTHEFVPVVTERRSQAQAAFESRLNAATVRTSRNRVLIDHSHQNPVHENSIIGVNGGIGALEHLYLREVVQTARYAGYAPPATRAQELDVIATLQELLRSERGRGYLHKVSETGEDIEAQNDLDAAIEDLLVRMQRALVDEQAGLVPDSGDEFGTGDLIPLVSYNARGELVGIHLLRHGHRPVREQLLRGAVSEDNLALGVDGVRLTIDRAKVDDLHTTHRGTLVERAWLGTQGFVARIRVRPSDLGSKVFELLSGMKWTTTEAPSDLRIPSSVVFAGQPVRGAADLVSPEAKNSDQWWLNSPDRIIETVGYDVRPHIVRALYGVEYREGQDNGEYFRRVNEATDLLRRFSQQHGGSVRAVDLVQRNTRDFTERVAAVLQEQLRDLFEDAPDLLAEVDQQSYADVTMLRLVLSSLAAGARLDEVLGAPGYIGAPAGTRSHTMHPVFTTLLAQLPADHPAKVAFVEQVNARMAATHDENGDGYILNPGGHTWTRRVTDSDGTVRHVEVVLSFAEVRNTDHNDALAEMAVERRGLGTVSPTTLAMAHVTWGADSVIDETKMRSHELFDRNPMLHGTVQQRMQRALNLGTAARPFVTRPDDDLPLSEAARRHIQNEAIPARQALAVTIDDTGWYEEMPKRKRDAARAEFNRLFEDVLYSLHLRPSQRLYLVEMIRAAVVRPAGVSREDGEFLTRHEAMAALRLIQRNAARGDWPLRGGAVNVVSRAALEAMYRQGYRLRRGDGTNRPLTSWDEWVDVMLSQAFSDDPEVRRYPATTNIIDGLLYEYRKDVKGLLASGTVNAELEAILRRVQEESGALITSPIVRNRLSYPGVQDGRAVYDVAQYETQDVALEELPQSARAIVEQRMASWEARTGLGRRQRQSPRAEAIRGAQLRETFARTNVLMRFVQMGFVLKTMVNVGLHVASYLELGVRAMQERAVSFLSGESLTSQAFTDEQRRLWRDTREALARNAEFYQMIYENTNWDPNGKAESRIEARLQRVVNFTTAMYNDPTWGQSSKAIANSFMEAAWDAIQKSKPYISPEQFLETLKNNPSALAEISADAVNYGYSRVEYRRNLQDNLAERARRAAVEGAIRHSPPGLNSLATLLLRFPTMFFRFRSNTLINLMGLQAPHAVLATLLSDRTKRPGGLFDRLRGLDADMDPTTTDQARIEDSLDLTRAIIRTGVSHTQLFMLGALLGSLGDDEDEARRLEKIRRYQREIVAKDPLSLENDFRNAEAWFLDMLPGGMGVPSWIVRMFVSPAMGVARFFETGDFRQVYWGFEDALGNMPLLNLDSVMNSWKVANELQAAAEAQAMKDNVEANVEAMRLLVMTVGTLENMLLESAFASMLYQASDEWDRDPYAIPLRESDGTIARDSVFNTPRPTDALEDFIDPETGEARQGYVTRNTIDATIRGLAENRPMLALVASMIARDSTYLRHNMVPKIREVESEALTAEEGAQLIMSILNNETGGEELTVDGAEAVVRGIHLGTVRADSPALQGVFIPREMREEIQTRVLTDLTEKYLDMGESKSKALSLAKEEFYGQGFGEPEALGFADILWDDSIIPMYQNQKYMQLNTTYVMGPNGRPVATGLQRNVLSAFGLTPVETFHAGQTSNMGVDQLLNSVDEVRGANLGLRALVKVDESWYTPTPEEIGEGIEKALAEIGRKIEDVNDAFGRQPFNYGRGWRNFGRGRYSRGGGYSSGIYTVRYGGQPVRFDAQRRVRSAYSDDVYSINTSNPIIRRATIRRERFASQRGRLNQWQ